MSHMIIIRPGFPNLFDPRLPFLDTEHSATPKAPIFTKKINADHFLDLIELNYCWYFMMIFHSQIERRIFSH